jgi:hypothetical protein
VLPRGQGKPASIHAGKVREGDGEVGDSQPVTLRQGQPGQVAEAPPDPEGDRRRQSGDGRRQRAAEA